MAGKPFLNHLDGDQPAERGIHCAVDYPHSTAIEFRGDFVAAKRSTACGELLGGYCID